jgi:hypothetical protein
MLFPSFRICQQSSQGHDRGGKFARWLPCCPPRLASSWAVRTPSPAPCCRDGYRRANRHARHPPASRRRQVPTSLNRHHRSAQQLLRSRSGTELWLGVIGQIREILHSSRTRSSSKAPKRSTRPAEPNSTHLWHWWTPYDRQHRNKEC